MISMYENSSEAARLCLTKNRVHHDFFLDIQVWPVLSKPDQNRGWMVQVMRRLHHPNAARVCLTKTRLHHDFFLDIQLWPGCEQP